MSPFFDGCYFDPGYFDASECSGPVIPGGGGMIGRRARAVRRLPPFVPDEFDAEFEVFD